MRCKAPESGNQTAACVQNHTELTFLTERNPKNLCVQKRPGELLLGIFAKIDFVYSLMRYRTIFANFPGIVILNLISYIIKLVFSL